MDQDRVETHEIITGTPDELIAQLHQAAAEHDKAEADRRAWKARGRPQAGVWKIDREAGTVERAY